MFRNSIDGIDRLLETEIPEGSIILVTGAEGTLKSALVFSLLSSELGDGGHGLYATLEQTKESHLSNMESLGVKSSDGLHVFDYQDMRLEWRDREPDMLKTTEEVLDFYSEKHGGLSLFALDSMNALYALSEATNLRREMYYFFDHLRDIGLTSLLIIEDNARRGPEHFLADGVIELGLVEGADGVKRYIRIRKMRATKHRMEKHQMVVSREGISILGPIY